MSPNREMLALARKPKPGTKDTKKSAGRSYGSKAGRTGILLVLPAVLVVAVLIAFPIMYASYLSFQRTSLISGRLVFAGIENYAKILTWGRFWNALRNTTIWVTASVSCAFVLGLMIALLLNQTFRGRLLFRLLILIPWVVPEIAVSTTWKWLYHPDFGMFNEILIALGLLDSRVAWLGEPRYALLMVIITNVWRITPFVVIMFLAGLQAIPKQLYKAAMIDGAGPVSSFFYVTLPQLKAVIRITVLLLTIWMLNSFGIVYVITRGGPADSTELLPILVYKLAFENMDLGLGCAVAITLFMIAFLFTVVYLRAVERGGLSA